MRLTEGLSADVFVRTEHVHCHTRDHGVQDGSADAETKVISRLCGEEVTGKRTAAIRKAKHRREEDAAHRE